MTLDAIVEAGRSLMNEEFGVYPVESGLRLEDSWSEFLLTTKAPRGIGGIYLPRHKAAHVNQASKYLPVNVMHEYFGHGSFCEHSTIGKNIVNNEKELELLELELTGLIELPLGRVLRIPSDHPLIPIYAAKQAELRNYLLQNYVTYEGFALWMEGHLAESMGHKCLFERKMGDSSAVSDTERRIFSQLQDFERRASKYAVFYAAGMPKHYSPESLADMLRTMYARELTEDDVVLLYGSQKPYSDIDLFVVSDHVKSYWNDWIDIYALTHEEFNRRLGLLDISVTDPVFSGKLIVGSSTWLGDCRQRALSQPITEESIGFNYTNADEQARLAAEADEGSRGRKICERYAASCKITADELLRGNKMLTLREIQKRYSI